MLPFWELTEDQRECRLNQALSLSSVARLDPHGIGMQRERTLHSVLKFYFEPDMNQQEIPVDSFITDIYHPEPMEAIEIQTGSFGPLREKLSFLLPSMPVTVVYPIIRSKQICWSDPETGEVSSPRLSPRKGHLWEVLPELYRIQSFLSDPHLSILPILLDAIEYKIQDGWSHDRKRGAHRADRLPTAIGPSVLLSSPEDYISLLPPLNSPFTASEFQRATRFSSRENSYALIALRTIGCIRICGKQGKAYLYDYHSVQHPII